jgi:lysophospholipase L1-like esterase
MTNRSAAVIVSLGSFAVALLLAEIVLTQFFPFPDPYYPHKVRPTERDYIPSAFAPHDTFRLAVEEGLPGVTGTSVFSTNNVGFRGDHLERPKPQNEVRIFLVGGSSLECFYLDDSEVVSQRLQDRLTARVPDQARVRVYNAAKSGDRTFDHLAMVVHRIAHLEPDLIIALVGVNDLRGAMNNVDYLLFRPKKERWSFVQLLRLAATEFQLPRRAYAVLRQSDERELLEEITLTSDIKGDVDLRRTRPVTDRPPAENLAAYVENLETLVAAARSTGAEIVLATQPTTWNSDVDHRAREWHWMTLVDGEVYREDLMDAGMQRYNDAMRAVARRHDVPMFDLDALLPKSLDFFYDDVHLNVRGADTTASLLADFLLRQDLSRSRPRSRVVSFRPSSANTRDD